MINPPKEPRGNHPDSVWLRDLLRYVKTITIKEGVGYRRNVTNDGTILNIATGGGASSVARFHPFKVYQSPAPPGGTANWKSVRVRAGTFWSETTRGTDGAANPDSNEIPDYSAADFVVEPFPGTNEYWVWLHRFEDGTSSIAHYWAPDLRGIPFEWPAFPVPDGRNLPIALITVDEANETLDIRQFLRTDALLLCTPP